MRILLVSTDSTFSKLVRSRMDASGWKYVLQRARTSAQFFEYFFTASPDLIVTRADGAPRLPLDTILKAAEDRKEAAPVIVLGEQDEVGLAIRLLGKQASGPWDHLQSEYLSLKEMHRFTPLVERMLRSRKGKDGHQRMEEDIRRASAAMKESQRLVTIGRLAGSIAHEINNPLESVTNLLYLMEHEREVPQRVREYLKLAQRELDRAVSISKQTLNFYRESAAPAPVWLSELLEEVLVLYGRRIAAKHIDVQSRFVGEDEVNVFPGEIRQIFSNLIANAIEASDDGGRLFLRIRRSRMWGDTGITGLRITVADTGMGMSAEVLQRIGEPFFTTKGQGGTGLGLWVSQAITKRYGGKLIVRSSTGKHHGTVFSIFLPLNLRPHVLGAPPGRSRFRQPVHSGGSHPGKPHLRRVEQRRGKDEKSEKAG